MTKPRRLILATNLSAEPSEEDLAYVKQLGIETVNAWIYGPDAEEKIRPDYYASRKELFEKAGLHLYGLGNGQVHNQDAIVLNLPDRDRKIELYLKHLEYLGKAGIPYTTYAHMGNGIWSTEPEFTRGRAKARAFDLSKATEGWWFDQKYSSPLSHGRIFSSEEIWENYTYFIRLAAPAAESAGVNIGIHPDDPPVPELGGIPRCIFSSFEGYRRALEIANSPRVGMCLCVGCWLEGGEGMGKDVYETIRYFGNQKKLFKVHFRNVEAPLPHFVETFPDSGYMNMYKVMQTLKEVNFDGVMIPDHVPQVIGSHRLAEAYTIGYMKALVDVLAD